MSNWAGILPEMMCLICKHVDSIKDLNAFGAVCSSWRLVALEHNFGHPLYLPLPWLMLAENQEYEEKKGSKRDIGKIIKMRNWAGILPEMMCLICKHVDSIKDLNAFGGVCSSWRLVALEHNFGHPLSLPLPWLMLAENQHGDSRDFYSVTEGKTYSFNLPELRGKKCMETKGWIVTSSDTGEMALVQPLTRVVISLPHQNTSSLPEDCRMQPLIFVQKVVLSSRPDPKNLRDCLVAILHGGLGHIAFCRPGDKVWTVDNNIESGIRCLEYYRGKFYVANNDGDIWEYDLIGKSKGIDHASPRRIEVNLEEYFSCREFYLVESAGSLLVVIRDGKYYHDDDRDTEFWVLKIDVEKRGYEEVESLGTRAIFLGHSATLSIDTNLYPEIIPNSIYFTDDFYEDYLSRPEGGGTDIGVYNLKNKIVRPHYSGKSLSLVCPPVWTFLTIR